MIKEVFIECIAGYGGDGGWIGGYSPIWPPGGVAPFEKTTFIEDSIL